MKKILIVTERRADYSKFRPLLRLIEKSSKLDYNLIVTGSHLLREHGYTINEIKKDGFKITSKFHMYDKRRTDTGAEMVRGLGKAITKLTRMVEKQKPDLILAGFDIGANLAVSIVGAHMNIVVAHLEGGEVTGTIDEPIRHAITKFAHLHFTTNKTATQRLVKMGEDPRFIFRVGNPSLDSIREVKSIPKKQLEKEFNLDLSKPFVIVTQHTVTTEISEIGKYFIQTLEAIKELKIQALIIHGNADAGSQKISKIIKKYAFQQYFTFPFEKYVNILKHASALVGNSSSGIMEAPFLHVPTVNIGTRQEGRLRSISIIDVDYDKNNIKKAIKKSINDKKFLRQIKKSTSHYGDGKSSKRIIKILETIDLKKIPIQKKLTY